MVVMAVDHVPPWRSDMDRVQDGAKHLAEGPERGGTDRMEERVNT